MNNMPTPADLLGTIPSATQAWILLGLGAVALFLAYRKGRQAYRALRLRPLEDVLTIVAAAIATGVSAQGMWRFAGDVLGLDGPIRFLLFAFIEVAIITSAVRARRNMREKFSAGVDGLAVWTLTCLTAVLSCMDAGSFAEGIFRLAAPLVAAWLWERGMAVERYRITGLAGINWAITPEKLLVRIGLAEAKDRTTTEVDMHRRLNEVALASVQARELVEAGASPRKQARAHKKRRAALERAQEHTDLATNPATQRMLLDKALTLRAGTDLSQLPDVLPWGDLDHPAVTGAARNSEAAKLAGALDEWTAAIEREHDPEVSAAVTSMAAYISGRNLPYNGGATQAATWTATGEQVAIDAADGDLESIISALHDDGSATGDATETATASATDAMWRHWQKVTGGEKRVPSGAELARAGNCAGSWGRAKRAEWLEEMDSGTRRKLLPVAKQVTA